MLDRRRLYYLAFGGWLVLAILLAAPVLAQQGPQEPAAPISEGEGVAAKTPPQEEKRDSQGGDNNQTAPDPVSNAAPIDNEGATEESCDPRCQAAEQREKGDLIAQQSMAKGTISLVSVAWWQAGIGLVALILLGFTVHYTRKASKHAEGVSKAANAAVAVTRETAERQLRAYVLGKGFEEGLSIWDGEIRDYIVIVRWENVGLTPATDIQTWIKFEKFPMNENREIIFTKTENATYTVLGPHSSDKQSMITIPLQTVMEKWHRQTEILVWARVEYRDTFDPNVVRHHEQCSILEVIHDPSEIPPKGHPPYVTFNVYGPQNTAD